MKNIALKFGAAVALATAALSAAAADVAPTPEKVTVCAACHGADGKAVQPIYPSLAGQYANYLEHALKEYRSGVRKNPIMAGQAAALSDADIHALAVYFSRQPSPLYTPSVHRRQKQE
jgi:cytochrome c553